MAPFVRRPLVSQVLDVYLSEQAGAKQTLKVTQEHVGPWQALQAILLGSMVSPHSLLWSGEGPSGHSPIGLRTEPPRAGLARDWLVSPSHVASSHLGVPARSALQQEDLAASGHSGGVPTCGPACACTCLAPTCGCTTRMRSSAVLASRTPAPASRPERTEADPAPRSWGGRWGHCLDVRCKEDTHGLRGFSSPKCLSKGWTSRQTLPRMAG